MLKDSCLISRRSLNVRCTAVDPVVVWAPGENEQNFLMSKFVISHADKEKDDSREQLLMENQL